MNKNKLRLMRAALGAALLTTPAAWADGNVRLADAQKAYADVDYESTRHLAKAALEAGGNDRAATAQLYLLWGTASAALEHSDDARTAFLYVVSMDPETKLDHSLSPKIRAPYLEARGSLVEGATALNLSIKPARQELVVELIDTSHLVAKVKLATRSREGETFTVAYLEATPHRRVPRPDASDLQYFLQALDRYGNVLFELGSEDNPERWARVVSTPPAAARDYRKNDRNRTPYYLTAGAFGVLGVAAGSVATVMYLRREDAAREWNGSDCERPGSTRAEQCANVDDRRQRAESMAIGFGAAGGALLLGSFVSLILAPSSPSKASVALEAAPGSAMLRLRTTL